MTKKKAKAIIKPITKQEVHSFVKNTLSLEGDEASLVKKLAEDLLPTFHEGKRTKRILTEISETSRDLMRIRETDYHCNVMEALPTQYRPMVDRMNKTITEEYDCQTELEKSLVSTIVHSYIRYIDNSRRLNNELECKEITKNRNVYIANLSKQVDRAHRQYLASIHSLKLLKAPAVNMKVNVDTAYMANQQQFNANTEHDSNTPT